MSNPPKNQDLTEATNPTSALSEACGPCYTAGDPGSSPHPVAAGMVSDERSERGVAQTSPDETPAAFSPEDRRLASTLAPPLPNPAAGMVSDEMSERIASSQPLASHETPAAGSESGAVGEAPTTAPEAGALPELSGYSESEIAVAGRRLATLRRVQKLIEPPEGAGPPLTLVDACEQVGVPASTYCRWRDRHMTRGFVGLIDGRCRSGRGADLVLTEEEETALRTLYLRSNRTDVAGSMQTAAKFLAYDPGTREDLRYLILRELEHGRVHGVIKRCLERVTPAHVEGNRRPRMNQKQHFSGQVGAFVGDKIDRARVVESDDGTLNFVMWMPWPIGGDRCSDKFGVRVGRWQILPAIECGWSHFYLGNAVVCRPRGSYRSEDIRSIIQHVMRAHGMPDRFRFERGSWESNAVLNLLKGLGVQLDTVNQPNHKPYVEGGFSTIWTYLSVIDGQVGRHRGDMEKENKLLQACKEGRADPREHFPSLAAGLKAIDGAYAMRNCDKQKSIYGDWIPEVRYREHKETKPWPQLPPEMEFLFNPYVREWTVAGGFVSGKIEILEDLKVPFSFEMTDLFRWNGRKIRLYFDPAADPCVATLVSLEDYHGFRKGEVIGRAPLMGEMPHIARAARGWADAEDQQAMRSRKAAMAALRRELRAYQPGGKVTHASSEIRDGQGNAARVESVSGDISACLPAAPSAPAVTAQRQSLAGLRAPTPEEWAQRKARLAEASQRNRELVNQLEEES